MPPIAVVGIPGKRSTEQLADAFRAQGAESLVLDAEALVHDVSSGEVSCGGVALSNCRAVAVKKLGDATSPVAPVRAVMLSAVEDAGVPVFSPARALARAVDRYEMTWRMARVGVPILDTVVTTDADEAAAFVKRVGRAVYKPRFTSKGRGMRVIADGPDLADELAAAAADRGDGAPFYLQRFLPDVERDIGVAVCDGAVLGAYYRVRGDHEWSTTTSAGGHYEACPLDDELEDIALRAAAAFGLTFTTVDIVRHDGAAYVYEVSAFGGFRGLETCGCDAATTFARAVLRRLAERKADTP